MKHSWKLCVAFGSMFVAVVLVAFLLLNGAMASADEEKKEFRTSETVSESVGGSASGSAILEGKESGEQKPETESEAVEKENGKKAEKAKKKAENDNFSLSTNASIAYGMEKRPLGEMIAIFAEFWKGVPYQYGGAELPDVDSIGWVEDGAECEKPDMNWTGDPKISQLDVRGVDSSGFVQAVFKYYNVELPRSCKEQEKMGENIRIKDAEAGDLIFYGASADEITHCGICLGDGRVAHSSSKEGKVIISDMNYRKIVSVKRVIEPELAPGKRDSK